MGPTRSVGFNRRRLKVTVETSCLAVDFHSSSWWS